MNPFRSGAEHDKSGFQVPRDSVLGADVSAHLRQRDCQLSVVLRCSWTDGIMRIVATLAMLVFVIACNTTPTTGPRATVQLRDGSSVSGMVLSTSAAELKIVSDDNITRSIPMPLVRSVEYGTAAVSPPAPAAGVRPTQASGSRASSSSASTPEPTTPPSVPAPVAAPPVAPPQAAPVPEAPALPPPTLDDVTTDTHVLQVGTEISVQTHETIDGSTAADGQTYDADVTESVRDADGKVVIPAGAKAQIIIKSLSQGGKIRGQSDLVLDLAAVSIDGRQYALSTADLEQKGRAGLGKNSRTAEFLGGGAAIGGVVGALLGGGKGAAIGAGAGAGGGALTQALTRGSIRVEAETILVFKLDMALEVVQRRR